MKYAQFEDATGTKIVSLFTSPQDPSHYANYAEVDDADPRVAAFEGLIAAPRVVTMRQARLAMLAAGIYDRVQPAIDALPDVQRKAAQIDWDFAQTVERTSPLVATLGAALGLDAAAIDALFAQAAAIQ